jgi:hypothetical protein
MVAARTGSLGVATTVGDLYVVDVNGDLERVPVGADDQVLVADPTAVGPSGTVIGVAWKNPDFVNNVSFQADAVDAVFKAVNIGGVIPLPAAGTRGTHAILNFVAGGNPRGIPWQKFMPAGYTVGSSLKVRVFWAPSSVDVGTVIWGVAFEADVSPTNLDVDDFDTLVDFVAQAASGTPERIQEASLTVPAADLDGILSGEALRMFIQRKSGTDTFTGIARLVRVVVEEVQP